MATETNFQESVCLKESGESFEEKVTELPGNKVKQLETSSQVAETVNTPLETGDQPTAESGIFFQALSVPVVIADEHSNTPESCKAAKQTEPEEEAEGKFVDAQEVSKQQKSEESVKKIEQDEEIEEIKPDVEMEKQEQTVLLQEINSDACISTQTKSQVEITEHEQKDEDEEKEQGGNVSEKDQNKFGIASAQEATFEGDLQEKNHHSEDNEHEVVETKGVMEEDTDVSVLTQTEIVKESIKDEEPDDGKAIQKEVCEENGSTKGVFEGGLEIYDRVEPSQKETLNMLEKDQGISDGVTSSQEAPCDNVEETTTVQHVTPVIDFKEQDLNEKPREFIKEETEDKSLDAQEASEECENGAKEEIEQNPEESIKKIEKEEETEEIKPGVEIEEKKEQSELLPAISNDVCILTQSKSQVDKIEHEEEDTQNDDSVKEKSDSPLIKEVSEETGSGKVEYEKEVKFSETAVILINKDEKEDDEKKQEVNVLEKDEGEDDLTSAKDVTFKKEKSHHNEDDEPEVITAEESIEKDGKVIRSSEKTEQQTLINPIPSDVCISTQTEPEEESTKKNDDESIERNDGQTKTQPEEELKLSDSSTMTLNEDETVRKDEDQGKEHVSEEGQTVGDDVTSLENASNKDIKETTIGQHDTKVACFETGQGPSATDRDFLLTEAEDKSVDAQEETEQYDDGAKGEREQKLEETVDEIAHSYTKNKQEEYNEEIKPSVESGEEKNACIATQIESQAIRNEENDKVREENDLKRTESKEEMQVSDSSNVKTREIADKDSEEAKSSDETKENIEQQGLPRVISTEETIENDGQTEKPESSLVEVVCEATSSKIAESEEGAKHPDSSSALLNENETPSKEEKLEKEHEIKTYEVQGGGDDVTISQNASNEEIKETTISQHDTTVAYVEEGQGVSAVTKEILIKEAEGKSFDAEEISLELGQPNEQNAEETQPCLSKTVSENPEDGIKKDDKDLSLKSVEDTNDNTIKEEKSALEHEPIEEHNGREEVSKENVAKSNETAEVELQEENTHSSSLKGSTEDTSNSEKEKAESETLPIEDLETVSEAQVPESVPKLEDSMLKEEFFVSETEAHLDEQKETITKEISSDKKTEVQGGGDDVTSSQNAFNKDIQETMIAQHDTTVAYVEEGQGVSATPKEILTEEAENKSTDVEEASLELGQPNEPNDEDTQGLSKTRSEIPEDEIKKENKDASHESVEDTNDDTTKEEKCTLEQEPMEVHSGEDEASTQKVTDLNKTAEAEPQDDITPSTSLETSTDDTTNSKKEKAESENLPLEDLETVSVVQIPELVPKSEESVLKEECFNSETKTRLDEEKGTTTKEISSDEKTEETSKIKQETVKEVCEEIRSEKDEFEGLTQSDSSNMKINEKDIITFKDDNQEKDHEVNMSAKSQGEDNITSSQIEVSGEKEDLKEKGYHNDGSGGVFLKNEGGVDEDAENNKSSVETKENTECVIDTNVFSSSQIKAVENDDNEIVSREENLEKKQEDVEETKMGEHSTTVAYFEEEVTKEVLCKDWDKSVVAKEETEQYDGGNDERKQKPQEHTNEINKCAETNEEKDVCISRQIESQEEATKNEKHVIESDDNRDKVTEIGTSEVQGGGDDVTSTQNASNEDIKETMISQHDTVVAYVEEGQGVSEIPKEILIEEAKDKSIDVEEMSLKLGQPNEQNVEETYSLSKTTSENQEDEIKKEGKDISHESEEDTNDKTTKEEKCALDPEPVEERSGQDEVSKEEVADLIETTKVEPQQDITHSTLLETSTKDTSNSEKEKAENEHFPIEDLETNSEVQIPELVPKSEESPQKEEGFISETETHLDEEKGTITKEISSDETTEIQQEIVTEVCEETSSEKAELKEELEVFDSSNLKKEKEITGVQDDDQEKDQEVNMSAESQGEENITSSQTEVSEEKEDLQETNNHNEGNEHGFIKSKGVDEDTEEVKSSVETKENTEHVITTNVCSSTQIEPEEETIENEENNGEKAIKNEVVSREENIENKQEGICSLAQIEPKEETIHNEETDEEAIENVDGQRNLENQQRKMSELQGSGDDVISSQTTPNDDTKETGQHATSVVQIEEGLGVKAITKEIITEEVEDKLVHAQEASEQSENGAKDKIKQPPEESVNKPANSCSESIEESIREEEEADAGNKKIESKLEAENQDDRKEDKSEMKDEVVLTEKVTEELGQPTEQNVVEIQTCPTATIGENTKDKTTKKDEDINQNVTKEEKCFPDGITREIEISTLEHEPVEERNDSQNEVPQEKVTDLNGTIAVEPQEDVMPSGLLGTSTEDASNSDKARAESKNLPIEDLESVSEVHIPEAMPRSEDSKIKEDCLISATETYVNEENVTVTKEISSDENLETHGSTQQPEKLYSATEENFTQLEQVGEVSSLYKNRDMTDDVTQGSQLNRIEDCSELVKDVILTEEIEQVPLENEKEKEVNDFREQIVEDDSYSPELEEKSAQNQKDMVHEISYSDSIPVGNPEVTEVNVDDQIGQEDLQGKEHVSCVSKVTNEVDQEPKKERIPSLEDSTTVETPVDLSNKESTAYPTKVAIEVDQELQALESNCDVEIPEVVADSEGSEVKEECILLAADDNNVEEQDIKTTEISSAPDREQEDVTKAPTKSDEAKSSDLIIEEKALTNEDLEIHGELKPTSEPVIEEDQCTIETKPQAEQSDITSENITSGQTLESKLEHTTEKDLEDGKKDNEEDVTLAPENEIKSTESQMETTKSIILTDGVVVETEKDNKINEIGQVSEDGICPTELDNKSTPNQKELAKEIEYSNPIPVESTEVTDVKDVKDAKSGNEAVADVIINEVLLENEKAKESKTIKDNEDTKLTQLTSDTYEVCQIERSSSRPDELLEAKDSVEDTEDPKFMADNLSVKHEAFTVVKGPNEDNEIIASEFERLENTVTKEDIIKADAEKEKVTSVEKEAMDVQMHEKDLDHETDTIEATSEFINQENQREQKNQADESIKSVIPVEDVKTSTREPEVGSVELELPSVMDATADKANNKTVEVHESTCDQSKPIEESSEMKQEPLEVNAPVTLGTAATEDLKISQKYVIDDLIKVSQTHPEIQKNEVPAFTVDKQQSPNETRPKESTESKMLTEKIDSSDEQGDPIAKPLIAETEILKANEASGTEPQSSNTVLIDQKEKSELAEPAKFKMADVMHEPAKGNSEVAEKLIGERDADLTKDQQVEKEEIGESGAKTDEEDEEEDNEDDDKMGSCSDAPVMVEASKDMDVKVHKKSNNILSGVGSKVKHSIAKVKKAITGKSSPPKSSSPKAKTQVIG